MQPAPFRLAQCIRTAFRSSRPSSRCLAATVLEFAQPRDLSTRIQWLRQSPGAQSRFYSEVPKQSPSPSPPTTKQQQDDHETKDAHAEVLARSVSEEPATKPAPNPLPSSKYTASPSPPHHDAAFNNLPSRIASRRTELTKRLSHLMDNVQSNIFVASQRLNDLTGYSGIEALKRDIEAQEENVKASRLAVKEARGVYAAAVATRSTTQREVNDLLQRKHMWSPSDLERFTGLYRSDHTNEQAEVRAQDELGRLERDAEEASSRLAQTILARYHEEQIWSDKIRQMSTWGTWGLMGVNVLLFLVFQVAIEPWRRRRLVKGFEEKVMEALEKEGGTIKALMPAMATAPMVDAPDAAMASVPEVTEVVTPPPATTTTTAPTLAPETESAIETMEAAEIAQETGQVVTPEQLLLPEDLAPDQPPPTPQDSSSTSSPSSQQTLSSYYAYYEDALRELFSDDKKLVVTQRQLTNVALEGACFGLAIGGAILLLLRPR